MKLQQLKYLIAIVDNGLNITAAADQIFTSQPGVSKQMKLLEDELGVHLFSRKGKGLADITSAGHEVINRARAIMQQVENIHNLASNLHGEQEGSLSIGTTHTQARYVLPEVIQNFRDCYPKVVLNLHQGTSEQIANMVAAKSIDFAIVFGSQQLFQDMVLLPCHRWDWSILAPADHKLAAHEGEITLEDLAKQPLVTYVYSLSGESSLKRAFEERKLKPNVVFTARDAGVIKTYVRMGLGVGIVPSMALECEDRKNLIAIDAAGLFPRSTTWIGFRRDAVLRKYMVEFMELFAPHLNEAIIEQSTEAQTQIDVDELFAGVNLPLKSGFEGGGSTAA